MNVHASSARATSADRPPRAIVLGTGARESVRQAAEQLRPQLDAHLEVVLVDLEGQHDLSTVSADLALVLGGDGSILRAATQMGDHQIPVIGVNLGKLGFLADLSPAELVSVLPDIARGQYRVVDHLMLTCQVVSQGQVLAECLGLNEVAVLGGPPYSMLEVDLYVDSEWVTTYSCDGLIISTPVGSTAHSLSAGGPILRKSLQAFVISPVSPHALTMRPVVDMADRQYELVVREPHAQTSVVVDGRPLRTLTRADRVLVRRATPQFQLVEVAGRGYYRTLREKLGWGGQSPGRKRNSTGGGERPLSSDCADFGILTKTGARKQPHADAITTRAVDRCTNHGGQSSFALRYDWFASDDWFQSIGFGGGDGAGRGTHQG